jgi:hypothetical protein
MGWRTFDVIEKKGMPSMNSATQSIQMSELASWYEEMITKKRRNDKAS